MKLPRDGGVRVLKWNTQCNKMLQNNTTKYPIYTTKQPYNNHYNSSSNCDCFFRYWIHKHILWFQIYKLQNKIFFIIWGRNVLICFVSTIMHWQIAIKNIHDISKILQYIMQNSYLYLYTTKIQVTVAVYSSWNNSVRFCNECKVKCFSSYNTSWSHMSMNEVILTCRPSTYTITSLVSIFHTNNLWIFKLQHIL